MRPDLQLGDCLKLLPRLPTASVDMVLVDPPYGKTALAWDKVLPFAALWREFDRVCTGPVLVMGVDPYTSLLITSNLKDFRYRLVWDKGKGSNPLLANRQPLRCHEDVAVFYKRQPPYNPQMRAGAPYKAPRTGGNRTNSVIGSGGDKKGFVQQSRPEGGSFPVSILRHSIHCGSKLHPTQKPVSLMEELVLTYTHAGMTVLDCCMGVGTTGVACARLGRRFIGMENKKEYFDIARRRIVQAVRSGGLQ